MPSTFLASLIREEMAILSYISTLWFSPFMNFVLMHFLDCIFKLFDFSVTTTTPHKSCLKDFVVRSVTIWTFVHLNPFFDKKKEYKAQWNFSEDRIKRGYDIDDEDIHTDVLGSYTGTPYDDSRPIQDADDL